MTSPGGSGADATGTADLTAQPLEQQAPDPTQRGRIAVVTGANRGLGRAIAAALAISGLHVVVTARTSAAADAAAADLAQAGHDVSSHQLDICDPASVARAFADIGYVHGRLDVLVNNAGVAIDRMQKAATPDMEKVTATLNTNLFGTWRACAAAIEQMRANGYGRIVNVTTHMATFDRLAAGSPAYRISKTALHALTMVLADELRGENILVNAASPGKVDTRLTYGTTDQTPEQATDTFTWLATLPDGGPTGGLFHDGKPLSW
jgi:NAD(P)-dependent dehydrogenase (short-subunit alcohol dehydrogenase family)